MPRWASSASSPSSLRRPSPATGTSAPAGAGDAAPGQPGREVVGPGDVPADGPRVRRPRRRRRCGPGRGRRDRGGRPRPRGARAPVGLGSGGATRRRTSGDSERQACSAAFCSASFFVRPSPVPRSRPPTTAVAVNSLRWSGPSSAIRYSGTPRRCAAVSSCRLVFQSRPAPSSGARAQQVVEQPVHQLARDLQPVLEVHRADQGLGGVGQDAGLVAAAGQLLAAAQVQVCAQPVAGQPRGDAGQRVHVHHAGAQLGQLPLGQVRVVPVQPLGDHDAQHRVAEELQPLVGRQPAVLVGVGAVGQRQREQLLLEPDAERGQQRLPVDGGLRVPRPTDR